MERLNFSSDGRYQGIEAAVHIARYSFAKQSCQGKRILDIACGEGYGSRLLANWGAASVVGVDISDEAIENANQYFSSEKVSFLKGTAETITNQLESHSFDMIVSFETIEHVTDPALFLRNMQVLLKPGGIIAISCPNDWWYFPTDEQRNPYHLRKYYFEEFREQTESVLGAADAWFMGAPIFGFANMRHQGYLADDGVSGQVQMQRTSAAREAQFVPAEFEAGPSPTNASYFLGIWGAPDYALASNSGTAILPLSMDSFKTGVFKGHLPRTDDLGNDVAQSSAPPPPLVEDSDYAALGHVERGIRDFSLRTEVAVAELALMHELTPNHGMTTELYAIVDSCRRDAIAIQQKLTAFRPQFAWYRYRAEAATKVLTGHDISNAERLRISDERDHALTERDHALAERDQLNIQRDRSIQEHQLTTAELERMALEVERYQRLSRLLPRWLRSGFLFMYRKLKALQGK